MRDLVALIDVKRSYGDGLWYHLEGEVIGELTAPYLAFTVMFNRQTGVSAQIHSIERLPEGTRISTKCAEPDSVEFMEMLQVHDEVLNIWSLEKEQYDQLADEVL